jgi:hypothetical protein
VPPSLSTSYSAHILYAETLFPRALTPFFRLCLCLWQAWSMRRAEPAAGSASDTLTHTFMLFAGRTGRGRSASVGQLTGRQNERSSHTADTTAAWRTPLGYYETSRPIFAMAVTLCARSAFGGCEVWCGGAYTNREGEIGKMGSSTTVASVGCIARSQGWRVAGPWNRIVSATMARVRNLRRARVYCTLAEHEDGCTGSHSFSGLCCDDFWTPDPKLLHAVGGEHDGVLSKTRRLRGGETDRGADQETQTQQLLVRQTAAQWKRRGVY